MAIEYCLNDFIRYKKKPTEKLRQKILNDYLPLVNNITHALTSKLYLSKELNVEELRSHGTIGLIEAFERFNYNLGNKFSTFATPRISGAILDAFRRFDWVSRGVCQRMKKLYHVTDSLEQELQRKPNSEELADGMGISLDGYYFSIAENDRRYISSLDNMIPCRDGSIVPVVETIEDEGSENPFNTTEHNDLSKLLKSVLGQLTPKESSIISMFYMHGLTPIEIGCSLNCTRQDVSQTFHRALRKLNKLMDGYGTE